MNGVTAVLGIFLNGGPGGLIPGGTRANVFQQIFLVFLVLGTLVGVVVISYMLYNAYKYRDTPGRTDEAVDRPMLGELPTGGGGGRKLFLSFFLSSVIVLSLIAWTYGTLLFVEQPAAAQPNDEMVVKVTGFQFGWKFEYPNGHTTSGELRIPEDQRVRFVVTSEDVFHAFGIPGLRVKTDAIPGQETTTWGLAEEPGTYRAECFELCGTGHSAMSADIIVMERAAFDAWYANTTATNETTPANQTTTAKVIA
ncbi:MULTISPECIES: cytochrome c oxidase subunit II [unclassified Haladaptatus]|uniref:cytochrome c oxidase subunit II n=1 Tax=unclassified Haladaptatus TaxID=2622732 RepID=UPI0023E7DA00|nr:MULTISPECIES: cytochrome c oxidase subunit II [unclassified Haladaptatus]